MSFDEMKDEVGKFSKECAELELGKGIGLKVNNLFIQVYRDEDPNFKNMFDIHTRSIINDYNIVDDELGVNITDLTSELYKIAFNGKQFHKA